MPTFLFYPSSALADSGNILSSFFIILQIYLVLMYLFTNFMVQK
nr:MAG TPA: hypothetical protein [Caudoviricetes sp.]